MGDELVCAAILTQMSVNGDTPLYFTNIGQCGIQSRRLLEIHDLKTIYRKSQKTVIKTSYSDATKYMPKMCFPKTNRLTKNLTRAASTL